MKKSNDGPLPTLIGMSLIVCVIASFMGVWELWIPVIAAIVVVGSMCHKR